MSQELRTIDQATISKLVLNGDMKGLSDQQKVDYYTYRCQQAGLDPAAKPFDILTLNGKMILYANASATQQLTSIHKLSHQVTNREMVDGIYCVFVRVYGTDGRSTENMGAVSVEGLKGENKANAMLKATTKAIRRTVLAHMGLGLMDETEVETIPGAVKGTLPVPGEQNQATGWPLEALEEFETTLERAYNAYKSGIDNPESAMKEYNKFAAKCKARKSEPAELVLTEMAAFVGKLEDAAAKKAAKAPVEPAA